MCDVADIGEDVVDLAGQTASFMTGGATGNAAFNGEDLMPAAMMDLNGLAMGFMGGFGGGLAPGGFPVPGGTGGMPGPLDWLSGGLNIFSGIEGLRRSREMEKLSRQAMERSDPFGPQRAQYAEELRMLRADPSRIQQIPGYKAGLQAVERKMASQGYNQSGNMMIALQDYGGRAFEAEQAKLAELAGATMRPDTGAVIQGQAAANDTASRSLASLGYGVRDFNRLIFNRRA